MKHISLLALVLLVVRLTVSGQSIEVPAGTPLTIQGNLNIPSGYSIQYSNQDYIKSPGSGSYNTYLGFQAGLTGSGGQNTFIGFQTGQSVTSGTYNTFLGYQSGITNTSGGYNVFIGQRAGNQNTTGASNLFMGSFAGGSNTAGSFNLFIGNSSGQGTSSGNGNTFIGDGSGYGNQSGSNNTYIGRATGYTGNNSGNNNTFIGYQAGVNSQSTNIENSSALGFNAVVSQSNSVIIGATGVLVGIGNSAPRNKLEITQGSSGNSGLRFTNLTSANTPNVSTNQFLTVNSNGDVVLALVGSSKGALRQSFEDDNDPKWVSSMEGNIINTNKGGVIIGEENLKAPKGYKLYVQEGILSEKVKVSVKNTDDWSDWVLTPAYKLPHLLKVDIFIKNHGHLPDILSAEEMVEKGNDLHQTDKQLLRKIEELTLYLIDHQKKILLLQKKNNAMKREMSKIQSFRKNISKH